MGVRPSLFSLLFKALSWHTVRLSGLDPHPTRGGTAYRHQKSHYPANKTTPCSGEGHASNRSVWLFISRARWPPWGWEDLS